ncbi:hypothetical protein L6164_005345 [Bauhinia variegata]|uniref:Uncharacterized protein n=1 Tax=Bauhinia variegata TaxID=167791 RepID=A0ACB9PR10_BAUVA|nr:hypothetical protein L6164_005345 [Bauhinia variegata]
MGGFDVHYLGDPRCIGCNDSGGICGSGASNNSQFSCHCPDGTRELTCRRHGHDCKEDLFGNLCPKSYNNISLDWDFYNYTSNDENSTLLYDCNPVLNTSVFPTNFNFSCPINGKGPRDAYFVRQTNWTDPTPLGCRISMRVPVLSLAVISFIANSSLDVGYVLDQGFEVRWAVDEANCEDCKRSGGKCGYNVTTAEFRCFCPDQPYATACGHKLSPPRNHIVVRNKVIIGIISGITGATLICIAICCSRCKISNLMMTKNDNNIEAFIRNNGALALKRYKFSEVKKMTNSFQVKLGQGNSFTETFITEYLKLLLD